MWWVPLVSAVVGGLIALCGGIGLEFIRHRLDDQRNRRALSGAFAGEIAAICAIARRRRYVEWLERLLEHVRTTGQPDRLMLYVTHDYFRVYHENSGVLGLLPPHVAENIPLFYTHAKSLLEDADPNGFGPMDAAAAERRLVDQIELLKDTLALGDKLVDQLRGIA